MKTKLTAFTAIILSLLVFSCKKEARTVPVQLLLTDNPAAYEKVNVDIKGIQVKVNQDSEGWITVDANEGIYDLLELQNGITTVIAQDNIPEGVLKEVRFILGPENTVVVDGETFPLQTPSAEDSGLKVKIDKQLNETLNTFTLDFDAALSVREENGSYRLSPVIKLKQ